LTISWNDPAVDGINFECRESEVFGLLGANGAGKTTTLRMLSTIIAPTSGTARVLGHDIVKDPAGVREVWDFFRRVPHSIRA
jgi:ABC-2 type transport system ATP-binding protein